MTVQDFKRDCAKVMRATWTTEREKWSVDYLLATLRHHGQQGEDLRQRALAAGL